jgi:hypothetical protein
VHIEATLLGGGAIDVGVLAAPITKICNRGISKKNLPGGAAHEAALCLLEGVALTVRVPY